MNKKQYILFNASIWVVAILFAFGLALMMPEELSTPMEIGSMLIAFGVGGVVALLSSLSSALLDLNKKEGKEP